MRLQSIEAVRSNVDQVVKLLFEVEDCLICTDLAPYSQDALGAVAVLQAKLKEFGRAQ